MSGVSENVTSPAEAKGGGGETIPAEGERIVILPPEKSSSSVKSLRSKGLLVFVVRTIATGIGKSLKSILVFPALLVVKDNLNNGSPSGIETKGSPIASHSIPIAPLSTSALLKLLILKAPIFSGSILLNVK